MFRKKCRSQASPVMSDGQSDLFSGLEKRIKKPVESVVKRLPDGEKANLETVKEMSKIARARSSHPRVRDMAIEILQDAGATSHHYAKEAKAVGLWTLNNVPYVKDPDGVELITDPLTMIDKTLVGKARGDCDDMSLLIATLLLSIGHEPNFRIVKYKADSPHYNHIYVVDYAANMGGPKERVVLDAIMKTKPIGWEVPHFFGREIPV